jgi:hypothetical protein
MAINRDSRLIQEIPQKCEPQSGKRETSSFSKTSLKQRHEFLLQQPAYVRGLFTEKNTYVCRLTQYRACTPLGLFKKRKEHEFLHGKDNRYAPEYDQDPLIDS